MLYGIQGVNNGVGILDSVCEYLYSNANYPDVIIRNLKSCDLIRKRTTNEPMTSNNEALWYKPAIFSSDYEKKDEGYKTLFIQPGKFNSRTYLYGLVRWGDGRRYFNDVSSDVWGYNIYNVWLSERFYYDASGSVTKGPIGAGIGYIYTGRTDTHNPLYYHATETLLETENQCGFSLAPVLIFPKTRYEISTEKNEERKI